MATRGWNDVTQADIARMQQKSTPSAKPSKYKNIRVEVDGIRFDSKREAGEWLRLKARELAGEISDLQRQVSFPLYAPIRQSQAVSVSSRIVGASVEVARYIADFTYIENGARFVVDAKGRRTAMYALKAKWLNLQDGIQIDER